MRGSAQSAAPSAWLRSRRSCTTCRPETGWRIDEPQLGFGRLFEVAQKIIAHARGVESARRRSLSARAAAVRAAALRGHRARSRRRWSARSRRGDRRALARRSARAGFDRPECAARNPRRKIDRQSAARRAARNAAFVASLSGNCSGEICESPFACTTSSRTAPSFTMRK